jgi:uncharacterized protein YecE (DUF72 family)
MPSPIIHIGTSGWHYNHWQGPFYPEDLAKSDFLRYYRQKFQTVEINNSFYQLPKEKTLIDWRETVSGDFLFAVKASRYITHLKKLTDTQEPVQRLLARIKLLAEKLGPVLFQLPPNFRFNAARLETFLQALPRDCRYALEFRDPSWLNPKTCRLLSDHQAAFCIYEFAGRCSPQEVTTDFVYIRLHGPGGACQGSYDLARLSEWARAISAWALQGKEVFCYFNNDQAGYAAQNALTLQNLLKG